MADDTAKHTSRTKAITRRSAESSGYPENVRGRQICISVSKNGVTVYGNRQAFRSLANWMKWLSESEASEHYECHMMWHFQLPLRGKRQRSVWTVFDGGTAKVFSSAGKHGDSFDLTFMTVEEHDLKELRKKAESSRPSPRTARQTRETKRRLRKAKAEAPGVPHAEVEAWVKSWGSRKERPKPKARS